MSWLRPCSIVIALVALAIAGCSGDGGDYREPDAPRFAAPSADAPRPRIALVLGSGGPRGFAHIGALKVLEAEGIKPDLIVGASVGAMVGALYAAGHSASAIEQLALNLNVLSLIDFSALLGGRRIGGASLARFVNNHCDGRTIEQFPLRFAAVAVDAADGRLAVFNRGNTGIAVRASSAIPGRFDPVRILGVDFTDVRYAYRVRSIAIAEAATRKMLPAIRAAIARDRPLADCDQDLSGCLRDAGPSAISRAAQRSAS